MTPSIKDKIQEIRKEFGLLNTEALEVFFRQYWDVEILRDIDRMRDYFLRAILREKELNAKITNKENKIDELEGKLFEKRQKIKTPKKSDIVACALANFFDWRRNIIVPNVSWGLGVHECDLLIVTPNGGYATEVEIKISKADLMKDKEKDHGHISDKIKYFYFAVPEELKHLVTEIPERAGMIIMRSGGYCEVIREATVNKNARALTQEELKHVAHLGCMRIWGLKEKIKNDRYELIAMNEELNSVKQFPINEEAANA